MGQEKIRKVFINLIQRMHDLGMHVAGMCLYFTEVRIIVTRPIACFVGFVSNGEHNVLRAAGYTRRVSLLRIKASVRGKYFKLSANKLCKMITAVGKFPKLMCKSFGNEVAQATVIRQLLKTLSLQCHKKFLPPC